MIAAADERSQLLVARRTALDLVQAVGSVRDVVSLTIPLNFVSRLSSG